MLAEIHETTWCHWSTVYTLHTDLCFYAILRNSSMADGLFGDDVSISFRYLLRNLNLMTIEPKFFSFVLTWIITRISLQLLHLQWQVCFHDMCKNLEQFQIVVNLSMCHESTSIRLITRCWITAKRFFLSNLIYEHSIDVGPLFTKIRHWYIVAVSTFAVWFVMEFWKIFHFNFE